MKGNKRGLIVIFCCTISLAPYLLKPLCFVPKYSLRSKIIFILALDFYVYLVLDYLFTFAVVLGLGPAHVLLLIYIYTTAHPNQGYGFPSNHSNMVSSQPSPSLLNHS